MNHIIGRAAMMLIAASIVVTIATLIVVAVPAVRNRLIATHDPVAYAVGDRIDLPDRLYAGSDYTAVLFARASCAVCQQGRRLFAAMLADLRRREGVRVVLVTGTTDRDEDRAYAMDLGLRDHEHESVDLGVLHLRRVPTLVIVNRHGTVIGAWEGMPMAAEQSAFESAVRSAIPR
jgi:hypothetical protein